MKYKIVFVVGHSNWGKSKTLQKLTKDSYRQRNIKIKDKIFFIRRMSNDDYPDGYYLFIDKIINKPKSNIIAAFCPKLIANSKISLKEVTNTINILNNLQSTGYQLYFWVIKQNHGGDKEISREEIECLKQYGIVNILANQLEAKDRAKELMTFISDTVLS